jgi:hypothetical protein
MESNVSFRCDVQDWQLKNISFYLWNSTQDLINSSYLEISGKNNYTIVNISNLSTDSYSWNCLSEDIKSNSAYSLSNFTLIIGEISTNLISPLNNTKTNINETNFTCEATTSEEYELSNITFYLWNSTQDLIYNETKEISGTNNQSIFNYSVNEKANYTWNCFSVNNNSDSVFANENYTIFYGFDEPIISTPVHSEITPSGVKITWNINESANYTLDYGTSQALGTRISNSSYNNSWSVSLSGLSSSTTYYYNITSCDEYQNCITNGSFSFTTSTPSTSSGTGDSGSTTSTTTDSSYSYRADKEEFEKGYSKELSVGDAIRFDLFDNQNKTKTHSVTLKNVSTNKAGFTIRSEPIEIEIKVGEIKFFSLESNTSDLSVTLNSIKNQKVNITVKKIDGNVLSVIENKTQEEMNDSQWRVFEEESTGFMEDIKSYFKNYGDYLWFLVGALIGGFIFFIVIIILTKYGKDKKTQTQTKSKR